MMTKKLMILGAALLMLAACEDGKSGGKGDGSGKSAGSAATTDTAAAEVPVEEDFEQEAADKITEDNLEEQVSALEKEIEGDG